MQHERCFKQFVQFALSTTMHRFNFLLCRIGHVHGYVNPEKNEKSVWYRHVLVLDMFYKKPNGSALFLGVRGVFLLCLDK